MFDSIERELSNGEIWSVGQYSQLPIHIQLLVEQEDGQRDIWELPEAKAETERNMKVNRLFQYF
ncbi:MULTISPECIES: hypothetical protein [unclassified Tolypothrix]|uniref:hypothetical protein n=1 Tax=unclassified Tolypothrix TaxID=2649714 RepID=UPI0005F7DCA9|nr:MULTISPECIES: hypothetical protein [unclassified Tolypothrix]MBE9085185.1 hypothetical protein [Tolypothrix sp. LEGE 11397]UYD24184.1 hypothetical protein HGR01_22150 [Tolypothrix sp. PCC 7712]UYD33587.1 hypothetical protein HG267_32560 [Tolypothrix sp. PCC 7601]BAY89952.1 hypothetical protein NIES3275_19560 [Microchaete diplosiphon NIES-3275]